MREHQRKFPGFTYSLIAKGLNRIPQQLLIGEWTIGFCRVKEIHPRLAGSPDQLYSFLPVSCWSVSKAHSITAKTNY